MEEILYKNEVLQKLDTSSELIIYGAGIMGKALKTCLTDKPYLLKITSFLVEKKATNPDFIDDIPVIEIAYAGQYKESLVLVALHEKHIFKAMETLYKEGFSNIISVSFDSDLWSDIRGNWFWKKSLLKNVQYADLKEDMFNGLHLYEVHSVADRLLKEESVLRDYEVPIQVGAALTEKDMFSIKDNQGEHISEKNRQYCELTALYWMWKNDKSEYVGLQHYRRKFVVEESRSENSVDLDIDVVVTVPVLNFPSVREQYCKDHDEKDWEIMLEAIGVLHPSYVETANVVQNGIYYFAYNMLIARKEIFDKYCEWLFPILFYCEERIGRKEDAYQNRYIGFLAERLLTIFFVHHQAEYKIVVARKHFIETAD